MWGAAWMTLFSEWMIALITFLVVYKVTKVKLRFVVASKAIFASAIMYLFLRFVPSLSVLVDILIAAVLYLAIMLLIKGIKMEDVRALRNARQAIE